MGRVNETGAKYIITRPDTGKRSFFRQTPEALQPYLYGQVSVPWLSKINDYKAPKTIKISLHTNDDVEALRRRDAISVQVDELYRHAEDRLNARQKLEMAQRVHALSFGQIHQMGDQLRHDILDTDDRVRFGEPGSDLAAVLVNVLRGRAGSAAEAGRAEDRAQDIELGFAEAHLKRRDVSAFDARIEEGEIDGSEELIDELLRLGTIKDPRAAAIVLDADANTQLDFTLAPSLTPSPVDVLLSENGATMQMGHPDRNRLALDLLRSKTQALRDVMKRREGEPIRTGERPQLLDLIPDAPTVSEMHEAWFKRVKPKKKQRDDNRNYLNAFISVFGDLPVTSVTKRHVREFRDLLAQRARDMPNEIARLPLRDQVAWTKQQSEPRLISAGSVNAKGVGALSAVMAIALRDDLITVNPCAGQLLDSDTYERLPYSVLELNLIFSTAIYDEGKRPLGGGEAAFWIPLIGLFAGARLEDIGQLLTGDIRREGTIDYFDFTDIDEEAERQGQTTADKKLKTPAARRRVPIHPILIGLGLLDYVARRRREGSRFVFPQLREYQGRRTKNWSKWWARHTNTFVTQSGRKVFHSFRHNFFERMREITGTDEAGKALGGHSAYMYGRTFSLEKRHELISRLDYPGLDLVVVRKAADCHPAAKRVSL